MRGREEGEIEHIEMEGCIGERKKGKVKIMEKVECSHDHDSTFATVQLAHKRQHFRVSTTQLMLVSQH